MVQQLSASDSRIERTEQPVAVVVVAVVVVAVVVVAVVVVAVVDAFAAVVVET